MDPEIMKQFAETLEGIRRWLGKISGNIEKTIMADTPQVRRGLQEAACNSGIHAWDHLAFVPNLLPVSAPSRLAMPEKQTQKIMIPAPVVWRICGCCGRVETCTTKGWVIVFHGKIGK